MPFDILEDAAYGREGSFEILEFGVVTLFRLKPTISSQFFHLCQPSVSFDWNKLAVVGEKERQSTSPPAHRFTGDD
jgi:hypothetical protein